MKRTIALLLLAVLFVWTASPATTLAAAKKPSKYQQYQYEKAKEKVESYLDQADILSNSSIERSKLYLKKPGFFNLYAAKRNWKQSNEYIQRFSKQMLIALEYKQKYPVEAGFAKWQTKQYEKYNEIHLRNLLAYRYLIQIAEVEAGIEDEFPKTLIIDKSSPLYPLFSRVSKGVIDVEPGFDGNIHVLIDNVVSPGLDKPIDVLSGYLTEMAVTEVFEDYFEGTELEGNDVIMSIPSAIGNTVAPSARLSRTMPYEIQVKLLGIQAQLYLEMDNLYAEITEVFEDTAIAIEENKKAEKPKQPQQDKKPSDSREECKTLKCIFENPYKN